MSSTGGPLLRLLLYERHCILNRETVFPLSHNSADSCPRESWPPVSTTLRPPAVEIEPCTQKRLASPAWTASSKVCFPNRQLPPVRQPQSDSHLQLPLLFQKREKTFKTVVRASSGSRSRALSETPRRQQTKPDTCGRPEESGGRAPRAAAAICTSHQS